MQNAKYLTIEQTGKTIVVTPSTNLSELAFERIETEAAEVFDLLDKQPRRNVVIDFQQTDYYGSTALSFFVKLWKRVRQAGGEMVFCNVSDHEREILEVTKLDALWGIYPTREEALAHVAS